MCVYMSQTVTLFNSIFQIQKNWLILSNDINGAMEMSAHFLNKRKKSFFLILNDYCPCEE